MFTFWVYNLLFFVFTPTNFFWTPIAMLLCLLMATQVPWEVSFALVTWELPSSMQPFWGSGVRHVKAQGVKAQGVKALGHVAIMRWETRTRYFNTRVSKIFAIFSPWVRLEHCVSLHWGGRYCVMNKTKFLILSMFPRTQGGLGH